MGNTCACGRDENENFSTWGDVTVTNVPIHYPRDDDELRRIIVAAKANKHKVKVMGAKHSGPGIVTNGKNDDGSDAGTQQMVISLAKYKPSTAGWNNGIDLNTDKQTVRSPAGKTFLDLYQVIRPQNYFLPTQTAGWFFAIGGVINNCVHGGVFGADMLNRYVSGLLVMNGNGEIKEITDEDELRYYRSSWGLLGIVLAVEFKVVERVNFKVDSNSGDFEWNEENFNSWVTTVKDRSIYGEFFLSFLGATNVDWATVEFLKDGEPIEDLDAMKKGYDRLVDFYIDYEHIEKLGDPTIDIVTKILSDKGLQNETNSKEAVKLWVHTTMSEVPKLVEKDYKEVNDGYWVRFATKARFMSYFIPIENAFQGLDAFRNFFQEHYNSDDHTNVCKINQPGEFRYVNFQENGPILFNLPPGEYLAVDLLTFSGFNQNLIYKAFAELERSWLELGAVPHVGKLFGFYEENASSGTQYLPFDKTAFKNTTMASDEARQAYAKKQLEEDPDGIFLTPCASWFLQ